MKQLNLHALSLKKTIFIMSTSKKKEKMHSLGTKAFFSLKRAYKYSVTKKKLGTKTWDFKRLSTKLTSHQKTSEAMNKQLKKNKDHFSRFGA